MIKKILYHSGFQTLAKIIGLTISIITTGLISRKLGAENYGRFSFIIVFITLLITISNWGTQIIGIRELAKTKDKQNLWKSLFKLRTILSIIAIIVGILVIFSTSLFKNTQVISLIALGLILLINTETSFNIIFQTFTRLDIQSLIEILNKTIFLFLLFILLNKNFGLLAPIIAQIVSKTITIFVSKIKAKNLLSLNGSSQKTIIKRLIKQSLPVGALLILFSTYDQAIDSFMIKKMLGYLSLGHYNLSYKIYSNLILPAYFLTTTVFPDMSSKKGGQLKKVFKTSFKIAGIGSLGLSLFFLIFSGPIVLLLGGKEFLAAILPLKILCLGLIFPWINHITGFGLIALNKQVASLKISIVALTWNLLFNLIFIPKYGIIAAAIITVTTEALVTFLSSKKLYQTIKS